MFVIETIENAHKSQIYAPYLCALKYQSVQKHTSALKLHNFKMGNRFHIAP